MGHKMIKKIIAAVILLWLILSSCLSTATEQAAEIQPFVLPAYLESLAQVSEYPFYEAQYKGDYEFEVYLQSGEYPSLTIEPVNSGAYACSCFAALGDADAPIFGRNFDWNEHPALILFTDPASGYKSVSMVDISYLGYDKEFTPLDDPEELLRAPYLPFDGMNENGLAVGTMSVGHAAGGSDENKVTLDSLELIRLMLDYARDVPEALKLIEDYNVDFGTVPVHYLLADRAGNSAVVEYLGGKPVVIEKEDAWQAATNFILTEEQPSGADSSCRRYNQIVRTMETSEGNLEIEEGMHLLQETSQGGETGTRWSIIYDLLNKTVSVVIDRDYQQVFAFSLDE